MQKLIRVKLDFQPVLEYVKDQLEGGMILPSTLLESIDFYKGYFFTVLPETADFSRIYKFREGGILVQPPIVFYEHKGETAAYAETPSLDVEIALYIYQIMKSNSQLTCLFEEICFTIKSPCTSFFLEKNALLLNNEQLFYLVNYKTSSLKFLETCIKRANATWYFLAILSEYLPKKKNLDLDEINEFCYHLKLIIFGAYDSEGYIFWEKINNS